MDRRYLYMEPVAATLARNPSNMYPPRHWIGLPDIETMLLSTPIHHRAVRRLFSEITLAQAVNTHFNSPLDIASTINIKSSVSHGHMECS